MIGVLDLKVITHNTITQSIKVSLVTCSGTLKRTSRKKREERFFYKLKRKFIVMMMKSFPFFKVPGDHNDYCSSPVITRIKDWCFYVIIKMSVQQRT